MSLEFSEQTRKKLKEIISRYSRKEASLLPVLHLTQKEFGCISKEAEKLVAELLEIKPIQVREAVTFYTMFSQKPVGKYHIQVCSNLSCSLLGSEKLIDYIKNRYGIRPGETTWDKKFTLSTVECLGACEMAPCMMINFDYYGNLDKEKIDEILDSLENEEEEKVLTQYFDLKTFHRIDAYLKKGGYQAVKKALKEMTPKKILEEVKKANLRGRGGAGFPAGIKWGFVPKDTDKPKYLCVNADEGEPGTFKDRYIMSHNPHMLVEGIIITSFCVGIHTAFIYIRGEYEAIALRLEQAISEAYENGFLGKNILKCGFDLDVYVHKGAGAYICGEETGLLESLEGKRGHPRLKPPFPASVGLFQFPTVINNVETISNVPHIILRGAEWFCQKGLPKDGGTRIFGVSGMVRKPGIYELPVGSNLKNIIFKYAGGMKDGKTLKAVIPGGMSAPVLKADEIDINMDFESLVNADSMLGSAAIIVIDEDTSMLDVLKIITKFYSHESCGQCTPCRIGTSWINKAVRRIIGGKGKKEDLDSIIRLASNIQGNTLCPMGDAAAMPILSIVQKFREEIESYISD